MEAGGNEKDPSTEKTIERLIISDMVVGDVFELRTLNTIYIIKKQKDGLYLSYQQTGEAKSEFSKVSRIFGDDTDESPNITLGQIFQVNFKADPYYISSHAVKLIKKINE